MYPYVIFNTIMITVAQLVEEALFHDDVALAAAKKGWLNLSSYARTLQHDIQQRLLKDVQLGTIITSLSRIVMDIKDSQGPIRGVLQGLTIHPNLEGMTFERTNEASARIRNIYSHARTTNKSYLTVTQGVNEVTIITETQVARTFRDSLKDVQKTYDKTNLVGITAKFKVGYLETPNLIASLTQRLAYRDINLIEIVSTATELTFILEKKDLPVALTQLQKEV